VDLILGSLVYQLPRGVTLAYDLRLGCTIAHWKVVIKKIHFWGLNENRSPKKPSFRPSKWPQKLKTAKNSKLPKLPENCFEPVGKGGWPPISTWISTPSLGRNGFHCVEFPGEREKHLLNLHLDELFSLLEKLRCLAC
jgi:hypothetical protein